MVLGLGVQGLEFGKNLGGLGGAKDRGERQHMALVVLPGEGLISKKGFKEKYYKHALLLLSREKMPPTKLLHKYFTITIMRKDATDKITTQMPDYYYQERRSYRLSTKTEESVSCWLSPS